MPDESVFEAFSRAPPPTGFPQAGVPNYQFPIPNSQFPDFGTERKSSHLIAGRIPCEFFNQK